MALSPELAAWLTKRGHNAVHALDLGLTRASDAVVLETARKQKRLVITADLDYPRVLALTRAEGPGLILFRGGNYSEHESTERLNRVLEKMPPEDLGRSIVVIERERIRRRRLPI